MKKLLAVILALALALSMGTAALAAEPDTIESATPDTNTAKQDVNVIVQTSAIEEVYSVDIEWGTLDFTYSFGDGAEWDPDTHTISGGTTPGWKNDSANIKVTNHSNVPVSIKAKFGSADTAELNGVTATLSENTFNLAAGVLDKHDEADNHEATVKITGTPSSDAKDISGDQSADSNFTVGTVTVTVSKPDSNVEP